MKIKNNTQKLLSNALELTPVIPGTIRTVYLTCGKKTCQCLDPSKKHGPYFFWDRKINGKLSSKSLNQDQALLVQAGIENRKKLNLIFQQILSIGENYASSLKKTLRLNTNNH